MMMDGTPFSQLIFRCIQVDEPPHAVISMALVVDI